MDIEDAGKFGLIKDVAGHQLPPEAFTTATNIRFRNNYAKKIPGHSRPFGTPLVTPYFLLPIQGLLDMYWIYCGLANVYAARGNVHSNITRAIGGNYSSDADDGWNGFEFNGLAILNNGLDDPQYWPTVDSSTLLQDLANWPANLLCKLMTGFKSHLFAFDVTNSGVRTFHEYRWSHAAETGTIPSSWDYTDSTLLAGQNYFDEDGGLVKAAGILGDSLIVYRQWATEEIRYVGFPKIFEHKRILNEKEGIFSKHCYAPLPSNQHIVLTANDLRIHNGSVSQSVIEGKMRDSLFADIGNTYKHRTFLAPNYKENEVWICYPETGQQWCTKALIYNYVEQKFSHRELPGLSYATWGISDTSAASTINANTTIINTNTQRIDQSNYDPTKGSLIAAKISTAKILKMDDGATFDGTTYTGTLQRTGLLFEGLKWIKKIYAIELSIEADAGTLITVKTGYTTTIDGDYTWGTGQTFTAGTDYKVNFNNDSNVGRVLGYEISATGSFKLTSLTIFHKVVGTK